MKQLKAILIGAGNRGEIYSNYCETHSDEINLIGVAEPVLSRRENIKHRNNIADEFCFESWEDILSVPKFADCAFISTQDRMHFKPAMKAIELGYNLLLEKPISPSPKECLILSNYAKERNVKILVCHVLRYTDFFNKLKDIIDSGAIGEIVSIAHNENVGNYHMAHSFVRGSWNNSDESSPMILQKSCHDVDILQWLIGKKCLNLSSFGSLKFFCEKNAPKNAPNRCTDGCEYSENCPYDAVKVYLKDEKNLWFRGTATELIEPTNEQVENALKTGPYGKCVFKCNNNVVDHQVVNMDFEDGITVSFSMCGFTPEIGRTIKIMGTTGEIGGNMEENSIIVTDFLTRKPKKIILEETQGHVGHGGGDEGIMNAFCKVLNNEYAGNAVCDIQTSCDNHMLSFAAEKSRLEKRVINMENYKKFIEQEG